MSELQDVAFWSGHTSGKYARVEGDKHTSTVTCRKKTLYILLGVLIVVFVVSVGVPVGLLDNYKKQLDSEKTNPSVGPLQQPTTASSISTNAPVPPQFLWNKYRLPTNVRPLRYDLKIHTNVVSEQPASGMDTVTFNGNVKITLQVSDSTNLIVLHSVALTISSVTLSTGMIGYTATWKENPTLEQVEITLPALMKTRVNYTLELEFSGQVLRGAISGLYRVDYRKDNNSTRTIVTTNFEPAYARKVFPCFDEPSFKAEFQLSIGRPKEWISLSNTRLDHTDEQTDMSVDVFESTPMMSTYLVAFAILDFGHAEPVHTDAAVANESVKVTIYARDTSQVSFAQDVTKLLLQKYAKFFAVPYPLPKLDIIAVPETDAGFAESWGLLMFQEYTIVYKEGIISDEEKGFLVSDIAHQLAYQWFGNLVTMEWWNDLWLTEGISTWVGFFIGMPYLSNAMKDDSLTNSEFFRGKLDVLHDDALSNSVAMTMPAEAVNSLTAIETRFSVTSYVKGASIIQMLNDYVGEEKTRNALHDYLMGFQYKTAKTEDLWNVFSQVAKANIGQIMEGWSSQRGYPLVTVQLSGNKLELSQSKFSLCSSCDASEHSNLTWHIPITAQIGGESISSPSQSLAVLNSSGLSLHIADGVTYKLNSHWNYYYIIHDKTSMMADISRLSDLDAVNVLVDSYLLLQAGKLSAATLLERLNQSTSHGGPMTIRYRNYVFYYLGKMVDQNYYVYKDFTHFVLKYVDMKSINISYTALSSMSAIDRYQMVWRLSTAIAIDHQRASEEVEGMKELTRIWSDYLSNPSTNISSVIHSDVFEPIGTCSFLLNELELWSVINDQYLYSNTHVEQAILRRILARSSDVLLLQKLLDQVVESNSGLLLQDGPDIIEDVYVNRRGRNIAWEFTKTNIKKLLQKYKSSWGFVDQILHGTTMFSSSDQVLKELTTLRSSYNLEAGARAEETVRINRQFRESFTELRTAVKKYF